MWRRHRDRRIPPAVEPGPLRDLPVSYPDPVLLPASVRGELLLAVPGDAPGSLQLDCLLWDDDLQASVPITVCAQLPQDSLAGYLSAMAVDAWCANHEDIAVELSMGGRKPRLTLSCRDARVVLALPPG